MLRYDREVRTFGRFVVSLCELLPGVGLKHWKPRGAYHSTLLLQHSTFMAEAASRA